ncbi:MAG: hypothetical protein RL024_1049 [Actinomycetota bacterium]
MIQLSRAAISIFALAFGMYHGVLGLLNFSHYEHPLYAVVAIGVYFLGLIVAVFDQPGLRLKDSKAVFSFVIALAIPLLMAASVSGSHRDNHSTWYVAGVATLMAVIALRQHKVLAWSGVILMSTQVLLWGGIGLLFSAGIFGALMLVTAAHSASVTLASSAKAAEDFREQALITSAATAAKTAARNERQLRVEQALGTALPILNKIERQAGNLSPEDREQALALEAILRDQIRGRHFDLEAILRDQIRGRHFDSPRLLSEISAARARGVEVQVLDDGGLDQLSEQQRDKLLAEVAKHVSTVFEGRLVLRSVADETWAVSVTATRPGSDSPDLFVRL